MNITDLIEALADIAQEHPDAEVRLAVQPSWPFEHTIRRVISPEDVADAAHERAAEQGVDFYDDYDPAGDPVVYLAEGGQIGYLPASTSAAAWE